MLLSWGRWGRALSFALLTLNVRRIRANFTSFTSSVEGELDSLGGDLDSFESTVESLLSGALVNSDGVLDQFTIGNQITPPISTQLKSSGIESNVTIGLYCETCSYPQPVAFDFASQNFTGWNSSWLGFALDSFDAVFEVEVDLSANANDELALSLWKTTAGTDGVVVEVEFQLYLTAVTAAEMSFVAGLNLSLLNPMAIMMPALDPVVNITESQIVGFSEDSFSLNPIFNASMPNLKFSVQLSLRTVFSVTVEEINIGALYLDLPAFNLTVNTMHDTTSNCQNPPAGTPPDNIYADLIHVDGVFVAELSYELFGGENNGTIDSWVMHDEWDKCFAFFPGLGYLGAPPASSTSPLLTANDISTCITQNGNGTGVITTTGPRAVRAALKSLSPGVKAGAIIAILGGVAIIAALAFLAGRTSLKRSIQNTGMTSWTASTPQPSGKSPPMVTEVGPL